MQKTLAVLYLLIFLQPSLGMAGAWCGPTKDASEEILQQTGPTKRVQEQDQNGLHFKLVERDEAALVDTVTTWPGNERFGRREKTRVIEKVKHASHMTITQNGLEIWRLNL